MARWLRGVVGLIVGLVSWDSPAAAQTPPPLKAGDQIQLAIRGTRHLTVSGFLTRLTADTVALRRKADEPETAYERATVSALSIAVGTKSGAGSGSRLGLKIGGIAGLFAGGGYSSTLDEVCAAGNECSGSLFGRTAKYALLGAGLGMVAGAGIGALFGSRQREPLWQAVDLAQVRFVLGPGPASDRGFRVGLAWSTSWLER